MGKIITTIINTKRKKEELGKHSRRKGKKESRREPRDNVENRKRTRQKKKMINKESGKRETEVRQERK